MTAMQGSTTAIRSYRLYFRDTSDVLARSDEVNLTSDDEARELATLMLEEQGIYQIAEVGTGRGSFAVCEENASEQASRGAQRTDFANVRHQELDSVH
jgi:hypothetical protein